MEGVIWKFPLEGGGVVEVAMPTGSKILALQAQSNQPCIWAVVDPDAPKEVRRFALCVTGGPILAGRYVGTVQLHGGGLVFHVFEVAKVAATTGPPPEACKEEGALELKRKVARRAAVMDLLLCIRLEAAAAIAVDIETSKAEFLRIAGGAYDVIADGVEARAAVMLETFESETPGTADPSGKVPSP